MRCFLKKKNLFSFDRGFIYSHMVGVIPLSAEMGNRFRKLFRVKSLANALSHFCMHFESRQLLSSPSFICHLAFFFTSTLCCLQNIRTCRMNRPSFSYSSISMIWKNGLLLSGPKYVCKGIKINCWEVCSLLVDLCVLYCACEIIVFSFHLKNHWQHIF